MSFFIVACSVGGGYLPFSLIVLRVTECLLGWEAVYANCQIDADEVNIVLGAPEEQGSTSLVPNLPAHFRNEVFLGGSLNMWDS